MKKIILTIMAILMSAQMIACGKEDITVIEPEPIVEAEENIIEPEINEEVVAETETAIEETTETTTETEEPVQELEPVPEPQAVYTYTDMSATMYATQTVNVRNLPSTDGEKVGSLSTNQEITVIGQCNETSWYMFDYNGQTAFVSNNYLSTEKVEVAPPATNTNNSSSEKTLVNVYDYPEGVWNDVGEIIFIICDKAYGDNYNNYAQPHAILEKRYPGNWVSGGGMPLPDGSGR